MKILFLGGNMSKSLVEWLEAQDERICYFEDKISMGFLKRVKPEFIISYNYKYIIQQEIIDFVKSKAINLHISYLPFNKGFHPNVWSFLEDTPKGVTIHYIDAGIDTGDIIIQKKVFIDEEKETLKSSYHILHKAIQSLFKENWKSIKEFKIKPQTQTGVGGMHFSKEIIRFQPFIKEKGWNTSIREIKEQYNKSLGSKSR